MRGRGGVPAEVRRNVIEFLFISSQKLGVPPVVKYTALSLFSDRFLFSIQSSNDRRVMRLLKDKEAGGWLLHPLTESSLQLFSLVSIWISNKIHDMSSLSVKKLKILSDLIIMDQHFTIRDFIEAELTFLEVLQFEIGVSNITFIFLENLFVQFRELSRIGELLDFGLCMDLMDLLYETEETSLLYHSPSLLAASLFASSYVLTIPKKQLEFPVLPWVKNVTSHKEEDVGEFVKKILRHILAPDTFKKQNSSSY